jgi:hypothetical protein
MPDKVSSIPSVGGSTWVTVSVRKGKNWLRRSGISRQLVSLALAAQAGVNVDMTKIIGGVFSSNFVEPNRFGVQE